MRCVICALIVSRAFAALVCLLLLSCFHGCNKFSQTEAASLHELIVVLHLPFRSVWNKFQSQSFGKPVCMSAGASSSFCELLPDVKKLHRGLAS